MKKLGPEWGKLKLPSPVVTVQTFTLARMFESTFLVVTDDTVTVAVRAH